MAKPSKFDKAILIDEIGHHLKSIQKALNAIIQSMDKLHGKDIKEVERLK
jgi:stage III sporulation protein SpoIIIAA